MTPEETSENAADEPLDLVVRLRAAADRSANGDGEWLQLVHRCREAADHIEKLRGIIGRQSNRPRLIRTEDSHIPAAGFGMDEW